ncbi:alcohol dehydrogenase catalytic domain-containing protein [Mycobacterium sp. 21AC1]|uniref:quinone oxidoreductase family protein n=1 Tax=[Mycobacterium] appelbergii TaxID=2939269 RepID=UPI002939349D|nr:alcohol dehydrogenase catalytic domain-containing protein [Mycobacterium sp. 21AC1]MDV3126731.1 alcohol dehydrogenase catalytic domain-containing protein [Mycobacterium sp. 21AC1]
MKAIRMHTVGGPDVLQVDEVDTPRPGADQVLIKVEAAAVAYGDIMKRRGDFGHDLPLPSGLGLAVAGTVSALGPDTAATAPGTRVLAWVEHGYAEYAVAPSGATFPLPDGVDSRTAAVLPVQGLTAYQALTDAGFGAADGEPAPIAQCLPLGSAADAHTAIGERRTIGATVLLP